MIFIGTHHADLQGPQRLEHLLKEIKPEIITIEADPLIAEFHARYAQIDWHAVFERLSHQFAIPDNLFKLAPEVNVAIGYETMVPLAYAKETGARIHFVDYRAEVQAAKGKMLEDLAIWKWEIIDHVFHFTLANHIYVPEMEALNYSDVRQIVQQKIDGTYQFISRASDVEIKERYSQAPNVNDPDVRKKAEHREQGMADEILRLRPDVHIGGALHTRHIPFADIPLIERISALNPQVIMLCDAFNYHPPK